ncbi:hypothetical protein QQF64_022046 [Cirrhinus molitorella]|uniref:Uncharacterized protein n=1 Tax=Cirrhinus molitorella TaxID=172907 RepID=A0ABR3L7B8_9TELE
MTVESSFQVLLKQDINECGTGEGLQSVITQPQLQTYIYTHTHRHPQRGEEHTLTEKKPGDLEEESEIHLIANACLASNVCFVYCSIEGFD